MAEAFDDGVDEFSCVVETVDPPFTRVAWIAFSAVVVSCASFAYSMFKIGKDVFRHTPEYSLHILPYVLLMDIVASVYAMYALKECHEMEGSASRGMALAATAISILACIMVSYSLYNFTILVQQSNA